MDHTRELQEKGISYVLAMSPERIIKLLPSLSYDSISELADLLINQHTEIVKRYWYLDPALLEETLERLGRGTDLGGGWLAGVDP